MPKPEVEAVALALRMAMVGMVEITTAAAVGLAAVTEEMAFLETQAVAAAGRGSLERLVLVLHQAVAAALQQPLLGKLVAQV